MSEPRLISPMLDNFLMGSSISEHHGVCCCPAMENDTNDRYIVKVISVPASPTQTDALILSGAFTDEDSALNYYKEISEEIAKEIDVLEKLSELEWFIPFKAHQLVPMESGKGFELYILGEYKRTLQKHFKRHIFTHLDALNLGLDLCAALAMCRKYGYLYVDLKPNNIFVTDQRQFRIGDLGFISLDALKYASLPERYQSVYTPPEVRDAFSTLNSTMDIYAAGLILYQTYNNGELPFNDDVQPGDPLPAPLYADYEIGEIILKACAPNPDDRWQDPMELRQAIINYMQRNGTMDTPIVPMPVQEEPEPTEQDDVDTAEDETAIEEVPDSVTTEDAQIENDSSEEIESIEEAEPVADAESVEGAETVEDAETDEDEVISDDASDECDPEEIPADNVEITEEVTEILNQADELATLEVPEPVVVPEHVDLPTPDPIEPEPEPDPEPDLEPEAEDDISGDTENIENTEAATETEEINEAEILLSDLMQEQDEAMESDTPPVRSHWIRNTIIALAIIALLAFGFYYYNNHYLLPIEFIAVEGSEDSLTVLVTTDIDESILQVICSDTYGNQIAAPVENGKAEFTGLVPNTAYSIKVVAKGFHRLTGSASTAYSTPIQTNIVQFDAITGSTKDSVILSFTAEGPVCNEWTVEYSADGEEQRTATFVDTQMLTLTGLTVGKEYLFRIVPKQDLYLTGQSEITFTPRELIRAEKLEVISCTNNTLTVTWSAPEGEEVSGWSVRCFNQDYSQSIVTTDTTVTFEGLDHTKEFDVEVKAIGMSVGEKVTVPANSVTVSNFNIDTSDPTKFTLSWQTSTPVPEDGWMLCYTIVGLGNEQTILCEANSAVIESLMPNATYRIHIEDIKGAVLLGSQEEITTGDAVNFQKQFETFSLSREDLTFYMVKTPPYPNWGRYDLSDDDYTTTFPVGQSASFLIRSKKSCYTSNELVTTMFVVRDASGTPLLTSQQTKIWGDMWTNYNCKMPIPTMPTQPGTYTLEVYFNGGLANVQAFTIQ